MAIRGGKSDLAGSVWISPLRLQGQSIPPEAVLLCRLLAIAALASGLAHQPVGLQVLLGAGAGAVLFTQYLFIGGTAVVAALVMLGGGSEASFNLYALVLSFGLVLVAEWPRTNPIVIWDGECGFCAMSKRCIERVDPDRLFHFATQQSGIGERWNLSAEHLQQRLYVINGPTILHSYEAWRFIIRQLAAFWMTLILVIAFIPNTWEFVLVALTIFFLSPLSNGVGNFAYRLVARNRNRLWPGGTCKVKPGHTN